MKKKVLKRDTSFLNFTDEDPLNGLANLFDLGLVFIVGLILTIFTAYKMQDLFDQKSKFTVMKQYEDGRMELIKKDGKKIKTVKMTKEKAFGEGERLGVAYKLKDGSTIYVPDTGEVK